jgi:3-hydroxybutyryl-CoA dehydrogenase
MSIQRIGVVGAGRMGSGIAQVAAQAGLDVTLSDVDDARVGAARQALEQSLGRLVAKGQMAEGDARQVVDRIRWTSRLVDHADRELVIEAVTENEALKRTVFVELDGVCPPATVLASNTSSISITRLAAVTRRPERFIGMHFMNPVPLMKLVEVVRGAATSDATYELTVALAQRLGKTTTTARDFPGFIANRILMPMINEAFFALQEGVGSAEDIDATLTLGANHPSGPLRLADHIGLDVCLAIMQVLHAELGDSKYRPCPLLRQYVAAGWLGRKSGRGIYDYAERKNG